VAQLWTSPVCNKQISFNTSTVIKKLRSLEMNAFGKCCKKICFQIIYLIHKKHKRRRSSCDYIRCLFDHGNLVEISGLHSLGLNCCLGYTGWHKKKRELLKCVVAATYIWQHCGTGTLSYRQPRHSVIMDQWNGQQRAFAVKMFYENNDSLEGARKEFRRFFSI